MPKDPGQDAPITLDISNIFMSPGDPRPLRREDLEALSGRVAAAHRDLLAGKGQVHDRAVPMLGWQQLPELVDPTHLARIRRVTDDLSRRVDAFVSVGIGGSYLGIEAAVKFLTHTHYNSLSRKARGDRPEIHFLGQNMDPDFFRDTLDLLEGKRVGINVISKSGTTTETAIAFRVLRGLLERAAPDQADRLVLVTTDAERGALRPLCQQKGYEAFVVPDDIGGRFSALCDVGLVGMAVAGVEMEQLLAGALAMKRRTDSEDFWKNPAMVHAAVRHLAWTRGKKVEVLATNSTALYQVCRFMEQLFPESEGHGGKGLWVSPSMYSEKLHANGQMVQEGERNILETFLRLGRHDARVQIPADPDSDDGLDYLAGKDLSFINDKVISGPAYAHFMGGVPNMTLNVPRRSAHCLGQLFYLLMRSVALSGTLLGHNPFIQPGVVAYKEAMFALAGKPGREAEARRMEAWMANQDKIEI